MFVRRLHVCNSAAFIAFLALSAAAATPTVQDSPGFIEEVVVTGTWIPGTPEDDALPVSRIDREDLTAEGSTGIVELVRNLSFSQGADGQSDQYGSRTGADRATVNLRGFGPSRTLVMLNSQRLAWSPGSVPDQAQLVLDVNLLPMAALRAWKCCATAPRPLWLGAVAGVVNFITRADFEGVEVEARHKAVEGSDGDQWLGLIAGRAFAGGGGRRGDIARPGAAGAAAHRGAGLGGAFVRRELPRRLVWNGNARHPRALGGVCKDCRRCRRHARRGRCRPELRTPRRGAHQRARGQVVRRRLPLPVHAVREPGPGHPAVAVVQRGLVAARLRRAFGG